MALPTSRAQLKNYCLREIGAPVNKINVADEQLEDRIDEALEKFLVHHMNGSHRTFFKHQITASTMNFTGALGFSYDKNEKITGETSGAKATVFDQAADNLSIRFTMDEGSTDFIDGETVTGPSGSAVIASYELGDMDNHWIPINDGILNVVEVITMTGLMGGGSLLSYKFQQALAAMPFWPSGNLNYYYQFKQHMKLVEEIFVGQKINEFSRIMGRLDIHMDWRNSVRVDDYIVLDCYVAVNANEYSKVFSDEFVREYTTALFMRQYAMNLYKFKEIRLLDGQVINAQGLMELANQMIKNALTRLKREYQEPPKFFMG